MARKGILSSDITRDAPRTEVLKPPAPVRGAVGALQSSLTRLQESAVQEIDAKLIDHAGIEDRLGVDSTAQAQLRESLRTYGQQVPILLRPHPTKPQRFEIVYGRRRLAALRELGMPVKALIRHLDDHALVMAQGQENTSRQDLSFIEKASFAVQLDQLGYERQTIADALSIDLPMVSRMLKVGGAFKMSFLRGIGSAPGIGRDRWMAMAALCEDPTARSRAVTFMNRPDFAGLTSDARFDAVFDHARKAGEPKAKVPPTRPRTLRSADGTALAEIRTTARGVALTVPKRGAAGFDTWINANAERLLAELHEQWRQDRSEDGEETTTGGTTKGQQ